MSDTQPETAIRDGAGDIRLGSTAGQIIATSDETREEIAARFSSTVEGAEREALRAAILLLDKEVATP